MAETLKENAFFPPAGGDALYAARRKTIRMAGTMPGNVIRKRGGKTTQSANNLRPGWLRCTPFIYLSTACSAGMRHTG